MEFSWDSLAQEIRDLCRLCRWLCPFEGNPPPPTKWCFFLRGFPLKRQSNANTLKRRNSPRWFKDPSHWNINVAWLALDFVLHVGRMLPPTSPKSPLPIELSNMRACWRGLQNLRFMHSSENQVALGSILTEEHALMLNDSTTWI